MDETLKEAKAWARDLMQKNAKPWKDFMPLSQPPTDWPTIEKHVTTNVLYLAGNYIQMAAVIVAFSLFLRPLLFVRFALCAALVGFAAFGRHAMPPQVKQYLQTGRQRTLAAIGVSVVILWLFGDFTYLLSVAVLAVLCVLAHALFHPVNRGAKLDQLRSNVKHWFTRVEQDLPDGGVVSAPEPDEEAGVDGGARDMLSGGYEAAVPAAGHSEGVTGLRGRGGSMS